jgi:hypothetical protein
MKKINSTYIDNLVQRVINETLEERADSLVSKIKTNVNELGGMEDGHPRFGKLNLTQMSDDEIADLMKRPVDNDDEYDFDNNEEETLDLTNMSDDDALQVFKDMGDDEFEEIDEDDCMECGKTDMYESSEVCECGGGIYEGECMECGASYMEEGIYDEEDLNNDDDFDYVAEEDDTLEFEDDETEEENTEFCKYQKKMFGPDDERYTEKCLGKSAVKDLSRRPISMNERLRGNQSKIDRNKNNKIDAEDFKMLRSKKTESNENYTMKDRVENNFEFLQEFCSQPHNMFKSVCDEYYNYTSKNDDNSEKSKNKETEIDEKLYGKQSRLDKNKNGKIDSEDFRMLRKESVKLTESEIIDLIEKIVLEQKEENKVKSNIKTTERPKGLAAYEKAVKGSKKENDDYIKSVAKKMKDYLKDGSKGEYTESPKHFPKGNGELAKMDKKAFSLTDENEDMNYEIAGLNIPVPDAIEFNEDMMDKYYEGSSETGNKPGGNALESEANSRFNKMRKKRTLDKIKKQSYNKSPQPVYNEKTGQEKGDGIKIKLESTQKDTRKLNEEFEKMKLLISYDRKTQ